MREVRLMDDVDWCKYIGRTTYGNIVSMETKVVPGCNIPIEARDFFAEAVMAIPIKGFNIAGRVGDIEDSTFIVAPEILKIVGPENSICVVFKTRGGRQLLAHPDNPAVILATDSVVEIVKGENEMPLDFRLGIYEALVVMK